MLGFMHGERAVRCAMVKGVGQIDGVVMTGND